MERQNRLPASQRLRFRIPTLEDAVFYMALLSDPDYIRFISDRGITTPEKARTFIEENTLPSFARQDGVGLWVVEEHASGTPIGLCGLVMRDGLDMPDLGYAFLKEHRGKGYAVEAAEAVVEFARTELELEGLCAITHPENARSADLLIKVGFHPEGQRVLPKIDGITNYFVADLNGRA